MTFSTNTGVGLNFIQKYDRNGDGALSKAELQQGAMASYFSAMTNMMMGNPVGAAQSFQDLMFASQAMKNFDILSQATTGLMYDNPNTISGFDLLKTAANDGKIQDISWFDLASQNQQNQVKGNYFLMQQQANQNYQNNNNYNNYNNYNSGSALDQIHNSYGILQQIGANQPAGYNNQPSYYQSLCTNSNLFQSINQPQQAQAQNEYGNWSLQGAAVGLAAGGLLALATGGAAVPFMIGGALLGSGVAGDMIMGLGDGINFLGDINMAIGNGIESVFSGVGDIFRKIPLVGGLVGGAFDIAGKIASFPAKLTGGITKAVGGIVKGVGSAVKKVGNFIKKL
jgi:hypothetical protein